MTQEEIENAIQQAMATMKATAIMGVIYYEKTTKKDLVENNAAMNFFKGVLRHQGVSGRDIELIEKRLIKEIKGENFVEISKNE